tara:strand:- start:290 stop:673 length:384 start_codon:yes stop_codon:yes gene_type:complete
MTLPQNIVDREYAKFQEDEAGLVRIRTITEGSLRPQGLRTGGRITEVTINASTWTALPVTALTDRNALGIQNRSGQEIKINYDNTTVGYVGVYMDDGEQRFYDITDDIQIYAKSSSSSCAVVVEEIS